MKRSQRQLGKQGFLLKSQSQLAVCQIKSLPSTCSQPGPASSWLHLKFNKKPGYFCGCKSPESWDFVLSTDVASVSRIGPGTERVLGNFAKRMRDLVI